jgi:ABC-type uncharacterized transport system permease subunit
LKKQAYAIASALLVGAGLIIIAGKNPIAAYTALFQEAIASVLVSLRFLGLPQ